MKVPITSSIQNDQDHSSQSRSNIQPKSSSNNISNSNNSTYHKNKSKSIEEFNQIRNDQLLKLSSLKPLSSTTTTNAVMHFIHTTIKFMNNISSEVNEKLVKLEDSIDEMEIKLSLIETKLDSINDE